MVDGYAISRDEQGDVVLGGGSRGFGGGIGSIGGLAGSNSGPGSLGDCWWSGKRMGET